MTTRLFKEDTEYMTVAGCDLGDEIQDLVTPILLKYKEAGYSIRDIELIATHAISGQCAEIALKTQHELRKQALPQINK